MEPELQSARPEAGSSFYSERFTQRLEAFSDLVFGFSLSLLATRLDVPADVSEVFGATRWGTFIVTFGTICALWLSHYRIFRRRFIARPTDVIINFIFLFGIAVLPYAVQTFLRFQGGRNAIILYLGDFALILAALAALRLSSLSQRRKDDDVDARFREWRGTVRQFINALLMIAFLLSINANAIPSEKLISFIPIGFIAVTLLTRFAIRRLPEFLQ